MKRYLALVTALTSLLLFLGASTSTAAPKPPAKPLTHSVTGTAENGAPFIGQYEIIEFLAKDGALYAVANVTGTLGGTPVSTEEPVLVPVDLEASGGRAAQAAKQSDTAAAVQAECDILNLVLGPLDLNILGLEVHLAQVVLDIVAVSGAGNLLGNLLCAVAGLLDGPGSPLQAIANLLNQILAILGSL